MSSMEIFEELRTIMLTCIIFGIISWVVFLVIQAHSLISIDKKLKDYDELLNRLEILERCHKNLVKEVEK